MASISVYGYDEEMLSAVSRINTTGTPCQTGDLQQHEEHHDICSLHLLPLEIRQNIYSNLLPSSVHVKGKGIAWLRGNTSILRTSKQIYSEAVKTMYGSSTFVLDVVWDCVTFAYQWLLPTGLVPKRTMAFPEDFSSRNLALIRKFHVRIHHPDNYTDVVKYNHSRLAQGLKDQVEILCKVLGDFPKIQKLHIHFQDESCTDSISQTVLGPFLCLENTQIASLSGSMATDIRQELMSHLSGAYYRN
ncbi:hypothetical protein MMC12_005961 [Toensbergia leucococca]|nr:hypothetical protein [Toensbergia leucococca]